MYYVTATGLTISFFLRNTYNVYSSQEIRHIFPKYLEDRGYVQTWEHDTS